MQPTPLTESQPTELSVPMLGISKGVVVELELCRTTGTLFETHGLRP